MTLRLLPTLSPKALWRKGLEGSRVFEREAFSCSRRSESSSPYRNTAPESGVLGRGRSSTLVDASEGGDCAVREIVGESEAMEGVRLDEGGERDPNGSGVLGRGRSSTDVEVDSEEGGVSRWSRLLSRPVVEVESAEVGAEGRGA